MRKLTIAITLLAAAASFAQAEDAALIAPPLLGGSPQDGAVDVPIDTLIWSANFEEQALVLVDADGQRDIPVVAELQTLAGPIRAFDPGELEPETNYSVLDTNGQFTLASFTTGTERAAAPAAPQVISTDENTGPGPVPVLTSRRFLSVQVEWDGLLLLVEPDGETLDELDAPEQVTEFDFLSFELEGQPIEKRLVAVNVAGELSEPGLLEYQQGGCAAVTGEVLALWPILGLIAWRRRRKES
jgi:hypothetical protein